MPAALRFILMAHADRRHALPAPLPHPRSASRYRRRRATTRAASTISASRPCWKRRSVLTNMTAVSFWKWKPAPSLRLATPATITPAPSCSVNNDATRRRRHGAVSELGCRTAHEIRHAKLANDFYARRGRAGGYIANGMFARDGRHGAWRGANGGRGAAQARAFKRGPVWQRNARAAAVAIRS